MVGTRAVAMLSLYVLGFAMAVATAKALKSSVLRSRNVAFIMELPPYRWPKWKSLGLRLMDRANAFIFRAGTVILGVSILLWALTYLPMHNGQPPAIGDSAIAKVGHFIEPAIRPLGFNWRIGWACSAPLPRAKSSSPPWEHCMESILNPTPWTYRKRSKAT